MVSRIAILIFVSVFGCTTYTADEPSPEKISQGKSLYTMNCMNCHGEHLDGNGPAGQFLKPKPRDLINGLYTAGGSPEKVFKTITNGLKKTTMVGFSHLSESERWKIVNYIFSVKEKPKDIDPKSLSAEDKQAAEIAEIIRKVKVQKAQKLDDSAQKIVSNYRCLQCHKANSSLNTPRLHGASKSYLVEQLWSFKEGRRRNVFMQSVMSKMGRSEIVKIAEYFSKLNRCDVRLDEIKGSGNKRRGKAKAVSCLGCHVKNSPMNAPILDGQNALYIAGQLRDIKSGRRENPFMGAVVQTLSSTDIEDLASYFGSLDTCPKKRGTIKKEVVEWKLPSHIIKKLKKESKTRGHSIEQLVHAALSAYLD